MSRRPPSFFSFSSTHSQVTSISTISFWTLTSEGCDLRRSVLINLPRDERHTRFLCIPIERICSNDFFWAACQRDASPHLFKWNFVPRVTVTGLSFFRGKREPNSRANISPVSIRRFTHYYMNSNRILCSRNCLENIYALKKEIILYFSFLEVGGRWGGGWLRGGVWERGFMLQFIWCGSFCQKGSWKWVDLLPKPPVNVYELI